MVDARSATSAQIAVGVSGPRRQGAPRCVAAVAQLLKRVIIRGRWMDAFRQSAAV